jgi:hypothetical protein
MRIQSFGSHYPVQYALPHPMQPTAPLVGTSPAFGVKTVSFGQVTHPVPSKPSPPLNPALGRKLDIYA